MKCATLTDEILHDHFPDFPMLPGALIVEAAAQLAGFLLEMTFNAAGSRVVRALLAQIQRAKFHEPVGPGDRIEIVATIDRDARVVGAGGLRGAGGRAARPPAAR